MDCNGTKRGKAIVWSLDCLLVPSELLLKAIYKGLELHVEARILA